jgi:hypothetical protein
VLLLVLTGGFLSSGPHSQGPCRVGKLPICVFYANKSPLCYHHFSEPWQNSQDRVAMLPNVLFEAVRKRRMSNSLPLPRTDPASQIKHVLCAICIWLLLQTLESQRDGQNQVLCKHSLLSIEVTQPEFIRAVTLESGR